VNASVLESADLVDNRRLIGRHQLGSEALESSSETYTVYKPRLLRRTVDMLSRHVVLTYYLIFFNLVVASELTSRGVRNTQQRYHVLMIIEVRFLYRWLHGHRLRQYTIVSPGARQAWSSLSQEPLVYFLADKTTWRKVTIRQQ
jgi:hypothetical protein